MQTLALAVVRNLELVGVVCFGVKGIWCFAVKRIKPNKKKTDGVHADVLLEARLLASERKRRNYMKEQINIFSVEITNVIITMLNFNFRYIM